MNRLLAAAPADIGPATLLATGATQIRAVFAAGQLPGVLVAYMAGIKAAMALGVAACGVAFLVSLASRFDKLDRGGEKKGAGAGEAGVVEGGGAV